MSNCIQMFELYSNVQIYIRMLNECVFSIWFQKIASSDDVGKKISQLHQVSMLIRKKFVFYMEGGEGVCTERDVTQEGSHEET